MKRGILFLVCVGVFMVGLCLPCSAQDKIKVEVLQVTSIEPFQKTYLGFVSELEKAGYVQGKNLVINRTIIDYDVEKGGLWKRVGVLMKIKSEASRIVTAKPDLVLTIGTPATKYAKDKVTAAGIPLVFSAVAIPQAAGCRSLTEAGPGFTGATLYMNMKDAVKIIRLAFPKAKVIGIAHSDDENAVAHMQEARKNGPSVGLTVVSKEIGKNDRITPTLVEFQKQGTDVIVVPLDTYYGLRDYEACRDLLRFTNSTKIPVISFALMKVPGAILYVGSDFGVIGSLSGRQAVKILRDGVKPGSLPILKQEDLKVMVDTKQLKAFNYQLPMEILQIAKSVE